MGEIEHKFTKDKIYSLILDSKASKNENFWEDYYSSFKNKSWVVADFLHEFKGYTDKVFESGIFPLMTASKKDNVEFLTKVYVENSNLLYRSHVEFFKLYEAFYENSCLLNGYKEVQERTVSMKDFTHWSLPFFAENDFDIP